MSWISMSRLHVLSTASIGNTLPPPKLIDSGYTRWQWYKTSGSRMSMRNLNVFTCNVFFFAIYHVGFYEVMRVMKLAKEEGLPHLFS